MDPYAYLIESKDKEFEHKSLRSFKLLKAYSFQRWTGEERVAKCSPGCQVHLDANAWHYWKQRRCMLLMCA